MATTNSELADRIETVRKVLELERSKGYRDESVIGGLEAFVARHLPEGREAVAGYSGLARASGPGW